MDHISILFSLDDTKSIWTFQLFGNRIIIGKIRNYTLNPSGDLMSVVVEDSEGNIGEIPWKNVQYIIHPKERVSK